jgi:hypothetical protein
MLKLSFISKSTDFTILRTTQHLFEQRLVKQFLRRVRTAHTPENSLQLLRGLENPELDLDTEGRTHIRGLDIST